MRVEVPKAGYAHPPLLEPCGCAQVFELFKQDVVVLDTVVRQDDTQVQLRRLIDHMRAWGDNTTWVSAAVTAAKSLEEVEEYIRRTKRRKAAGPDEIPIERNCVHLPIRTRLHAAADDGGADPAPCVARQDYWPSIHALDG